MISFAEFSIFKLMSPWVVVPAFLAFAPLGLAETAPTDTDSLKTPEEVENRLTDKITKNLNLFLGEHEYRIFATAKIENIREKVLLEGSTEAISTGEEKTASKQGQLPGFTAVEPAKDSAKNINRNVKSRFTFRNRTKLTDVSVRLILEPKLQQNAKDLAIKTAKDAISLTVGNAGKLDVVELDLTPPSKPTTMLDWATQYLTQRGGSAIDLLYLSLLLLGSLGTVFALRHYFKGRKHAKSELAAAKSTDGFNQQKMDNFCGLKLDELIGLLNKNPLITRNFLQNLQNDDKQFLYKSLKTPALQSIFRKILIINPDLRSEGKEKNNQDSGNTFDKILMDLKRFICLNVEMESRAFGYVPQLSGNQIAQFIATEAERVKSLTVIAPYLAEHHIRGVTELLSVSEKASFMESMRNRNGDLMHDTASVAPEALIFRSQVESRLRDSYETVRREAVVDTTEKMTLESSFLEFDADSVAVIKQLAIRYGKVPGIYEKYLVGFEEFLGLDLGIAKKVLQRVSNEVLTQALADRELDAKLVAMLGDMRSQLLASLKKRDLKVSKNEMESARNEVLRQYRSMV